MKWHRPWQLGPRGNGKPCLPAPWCKFNRPPQRRRNPPALGPRPPTPSSSPPALPRLSPAPSRNQLRLPMAVGPVGLGPLGLAGCSPRPAGRPPLAMGIGKRNPEECLWRAAGAALPWPWAALSWKAEGGGSSRGRSAAGLAPAGQGLYMTSPARP